jgi:hypothetical protein
MKPPDELAERARAGNVEVLRRAARIVLEDSGYPSSRLHGEDALHAGVVWGYLTRLADKMEGKR